MTENYPRPDFVRTNLKWKSLNGPWDFLFDDDNVGLTQKWQLGLPNSVTARGSNAKSNSNVIKKITAQPDKLLQDNQFTSDSKTYEKRKINVPYVFQTPASGINDRNAHEVIWYERNVEDIRREGENLLLRFGAVDYEATVWINGQYVGFHRGGHVPFEFEIEPGRLTIRVRDSPSDLTQPRGKQYWAAKPESIFYTPSSGIWQSVWLESVPPVRITNVILRPDIENGKLLVSGRGRLEVRSSIEGVEVGQGNSEINMRLPSPGELLPEFLKKAPPDNTQIWRDGVVLWSPEYPFLYDITIRLVDGDDEIKTTIGMRSINWKSGDGTFRLNGFPYFQALVLDQGYWPRTGMTGSSEDHKRDIELAKDMGFNGCRKHQKVEDPIFLYWADRLGYLVWGEMASAYEFDDVYVERFNQEWLEAVRRDINHPCIVTWTPVNETWGYPALRENEQQQNHIRSLYYMTKTLDPTRPINDNCGWEHVCTDLTTFHDYNDGTVLREICSKMEKILEPKAGRDMFIGSVTPGAPILCTEFGGVNIAGGSGQDWGYTTAKNSEDLLSRVESLVMGVVEGNHCCGFVYTQLADIEQEVNGLYSFDRKPKLDPVKVKDIMNRAKDWYFKAQ